MQAALQRSGLEAAVTLRCSRELKSSLEQALSAAQTARALLIGICYKEDEELRLEGSWNDVEDMRSWLLRQGIVREQDHACSMRQFRRRDTDAFAKQHS